MIVDQFQGYIEGKDLTKVPMNNLVYPSKNVIVSKGTIFTRGGLVNDGVVSTVSEAVHSEFVWKDALGGQRPIRVHGNTVQVKYNSKWYTIYTGLTADTPRVFFATWIDSNGAIYKKRLFFCDGSPHLHQWNGAIAVVESATANTAVFATAGGTCVQRGFDDGSGTAQSIMHFIGSAVTANSTESQTNNPTAQTLSISGTFNTTPVAGDVIIAAPVKFSNVIASTYNIDAIYSYKNHIITGNYDSVSLYWSHIATYSLATGLDFAMPASASRTAATAILMVLDGNFTAMISRKNIFWISDADDWYKITKSTAQNAYGLWVDVEKFDTGEHKGALPMAVAKQKSDIIYMAQDSTLQRITSIDVLGTDDVKLISDDISDLLDRTDMTDVRLYYLSRAIYIISPQDSTMLILDLVEGFFQPPQIIPINCMSVIDGVKYGHHNAQDETYTLFSGRDDLDTPIQSVIAFGLYHGDSNDNHPFRLKWHSMVGISSRMTLNTIVTAEQKFEEEGAVRSEEFIIDGATVTAYVTNDDVSWATHPYAERSWGGADMVSNDLRRVICYSKNQATPYLDHQLKFTVSSSIVDNVETMESEFQLLALYLDDGFAQRKLNNNLFISK